MCFIFWKKIYCLCLHDRDFILQGVCSSFHSGESNYRTNHKSYLLGLSLDWGKHRGTCLGRGDTYLIAPASPRLDKRSIPWSTVIGLGWACNPNAINELPSWDFTWPYWERGCHFLLGNKVDRWSSQEHLCLEGRNCQMVKLTWAFAPAVPSAWKVLHLNIRFHSFPFFF